MDSLQADFVAAGGPAVTRGVLMTSGEGHESVRISHPAALVRFISFAKNRAAQQGGQVFFRGQREDVSRMRPCLYRDADQATAERRRDAYLTLLDRLPAELHVSRFDRINSGAILQHYGINTPWLDVVDNIYTALWFALHERYAEAGKVRYVRRKTGMAWIILLSTRRAGFPDLHIADLRVTQASLNMRLHMQHGVTLASAQDSESSPGRLSMEDHVIGRVCMPIGASWNLKGWLYSQGYMFPPATVDHTYRILRRRHVQDLISRVERQCRVDGALGRITRYAYRPLKLA